MRLFLFLPLLLVLALASIAGWRATLFGHFYVAGWAIAVLLTRIPPLRRDSRPRLNRWMAALLLVGFAWISGVGRYPGASVGVAGFAAFHGVILCAYGAVLFGILRLARAEDRLDEDFLRRDLWLLNLALFCFVFLCLVQIMREGLSVSTALSALVRAVQPLSFILLLLLALRAGREAAGERAVGLLTLAAAGLWLGMGGLRVAEIEYTLREARVRLLEGKSEKALESLNAAAAANRYLRMAAFAEREARLRSRAYADENESDLALGHLIQYLQGRLLRGGGEVAPWKDLLLLYLEKQSLETAFFPRMEGAGSLRALEEMHRALAQVPEEEERLLALFLQNGFPDRLEERYAWSGLPAAGDSDALELSLERWRRDATGAENRASFLLGVLLFRTQSYEGARGLFENVLEKDPEHHNAITFLERLLAMREDLRQRARLRILPRRLAREEMMGGRMEGSKVLYAALETNPGRYDFRFEIRNRGPAPATFRVFLDAVAEPVLEETVSPSDWNEVGIEMDFNEEARHTLMLVLGGESEAHESVSSTGKPALDFRAVKIRPLFE